MKNSNEINYILRGSILSLTFLLISTSIFGSASQIIAVENNFESVSNTSNASSLESGPIKDFRGATISDLDALQKEIAQVKKQQQDIQQTIDSAKQQQNEYSGQIALVAAERNLIQKQIEEKELVIRELNLQIEILNNTINDTEKVIAKTETELIDLDVKATAQLSEMYLDQKTFNSNLNLIFASGDVDFVKKGLYQQTIQEDTNNSLRLLRDKEIRLNSDKEKLLTDRVSVDQDRLKLEEERSGLDGKRAELQRKIGQINSLLAETQKSISANESVYQSLDQKEKDLQTKLEAIQRSISDSAGGIATGEYVIAGQIVGYEGNTGVSTGPHLHFVVRVNGGYVNPCNHLPAKTLMGGTYCGTSQPTLTNWPMSQNAWFTSGFRPPSRPSHNAIDLSRGGGTAILATHNGWIRRGLNDNACSWYVGAFPCNGQGANGVIICEEKDCKTGIQTEYWHLQ